MNSVAEMQPTLTEGGVHGNLPTENDPLNNEQKQRKCYENEMENCRIPFQKHAEYITQRKETSVI